MQNETMGDAIARHLAETGITTVFGVIPIHNMPILDAIARQGRIRIVPARGEAGAMNMADAYARVSGQVGVAITSTGVEPGNAVGAQLGALTAGTRLLHITSQVDRAFMDRDRGAIHDVPRQFDMLKAASKPCLRLWEARSVHTVLTGALSAAISAPSGPVSLEVPVDLQRQMVPVRQTPRAPQQDIDALAERIRSARRPMLWLGGGAREASAQANALVARGFGAVCCTNGRAVVADDHPATLGAFNMSPFAQEIYAQCDLMLVVGSRLRRNETRNNKLPLPNPLIQIDAKASQGARNYDVAQFIHGDAADSLQRLLDALPENLELDPGFAHEISVAPAKSEGALRDQLGVYRVIADALQERVLPDGHPFVRDVTISNSTFGNRYVHLTEPGHGVHALSGGIGQGISMGIGAGLAPDAAKSIVLLRVGGAQLALAELITAEPERANLVYVMMNDQAYGVIRNIQDAQYGGRHDYSALQPPDFAELCGSIGLSHCLISHESAFADVLDQALTSQGPVLLEVETCAVGDFAQPFAGPPAGAAGKHHELSLSHAGR